MPITGSFPVAGNSVLVPSFRREDQQFSPALIDPQRFPKSPPSGRARPVSMACAEVCLDL